MPTFLHSFDTESFMRKAPLILTFLSSLVFSSCAAAPGKDASTIVKIHSDKKRTNGSPQGDFASSDSHPGEWVVQLRYSRLAASVLRRISCHYLFTIYDPEKKAWERRELWRRGPFFGTLKPTKTKDWGHIREDMFTPDRPIGSKNVMVVQDEWRGEEALSLVKVLRDPESYPRRHRYWGWPGPNSNTYAAWVLREAGVSADMSPLAIGKDDLGVIGFAPSTTKTGLQFYAYIIGWKIGLLDGVELHLLGGLTLGVDFWQPALKTPLGRLGWQETLGEVKKKKR